MKMRAKLKIVSQRPLTNLARETIKISRLKPIRMLVKPKTTKWPLDQECDAVQKA